LFSLDYKYYSSRNALKCPFFDPSGNYIYMCADENGTYGKNGYAGAYVMRLETGQPLDFKQEMNVSGYYYKTKFFTRLTIQYDGNSIISHLTFYPEMNKNPRILIIDADTFMNDNLKINYLFEGGREITLTVKNEGLMNKGEFYTDSNGLYNIKRERIHSNQINKFPDAHDIPTNYYPVVSQISINNQKTIGKMKKVISSMDIYNDRSQGGTSYREGEIELLIARYINTDDSLGLSENIILQEKMYLNHKIVFQDYEAHSSKNEDISKLGQRNNFMYLSFLKNFDDFDIKKEKSFGSKFVDILNEIPNYIKIDLNPVNFDEVVIRIQDIYHEDNKDSLDVKGNIIEKMETICQNDKKDKCVNLHCKETLLDGFTEMVIQSQNNKENIMKHPHDIITLSCIKAHEKSQQNNKGLFRKKKNLIVRK